MLIGLDRKRFETTLIDGASSRGVMMGMPALRMGHGDPAKNFGEFSILPGPEEEMPVIGHETVGGNPEARMRGSVSENLFKGKIVGSLFKQRQSPHTTVQDVIGEAAGN